MVVSLAGNRMSSGENPLRADAAVRCAVIVGAEPAEEREHRMRCAACPGEGTPGGCRPGPVAALR